MGSEDKSRTGFLWEKEMLPRWTSGERVAEVGIRPPIDKGDAGMNRPPWAQKALLG